MNKALENRTFLIRIMFYYHFSQRDKLEDLLRTVTTDRKKIGELMVWCLDHADFADEVRAYLLPLFYIFNLLDLVLVFCHYVHSVTEIFSTEIKTSFIRSM